MIFYRERCSAINILKKKEASFSQTDYSVRYLYERYNLRKEMTCADTALSELREVESDMAVSAPYKVLLARCLYKEGAEKEAYQKLSEAFNVFLTREEAAEIYLMAAEFLKHEGRNAACAAALVAGHAWAPENTKISERAGHMDIAHLLKGKNVKAVLFKNGIAPMPEIFYGKLFDAMQNNAQYAEDIGDDMVFVLTNSYSSVLSYRVSAEDLIGNGAVMDSIPKSFKTVRLKTLREEQDTMTHRLAKIASVPEIMGIFEKVKTLPEKEMLARGKIWLRLLETTYSDVLTQSYIFEGDAELALYRAYTRDDTIFPGNNAAGYFAYMLGNTYFEKDNLDEAYYYMKKAEVYLPASIGVKFGLVQILVLRGETQEALEVLKKAIFYATTPELMAESYAGIAMQYYTDGDMEGACAALVASRAWNSGHPETLQMLESIAGFSEFMTVAEVRACLKERDVPDKPEVVIRKNLNKSCDGLEKDGLMYNGTLISMAENLIMETSFKNALNTLIKARELDF